MTPAEEIAAAATKLRALAAAVLDDIAINPYWASSEHPPHAHPSLYARGVDNGLGGPAGAFAAAMGPNVGATLADWLDAEASTWAGDEVHYRCAVQNCTLEAALAVARAINDGGEQR